MKMKNIMKNVIWMLLFNVMAWVGFMLLCPVDNSVDELFYDLYRLIVFGYMFLCPIIITIFFAKFGNISKKLKDVMIFNGLWFGVSLSIELLIFFGIEERGMGWEALIYYFFGIAFVGISTALLLIVTFIKWVCISKQSDVNTNTSSGRTDYAVDMTDKMNDSL